ncbi:MULTISPECIES: acyl-CoA dehydrogenase family protein [Streptomyces]|uniref:acyl-CoA dehydrogenase family protein n=1 Tax=Streptomyces TaxID=1883 RepID=UPI001C8C1759|nr:acyl-CoA dehydrogenase family protein [Streptomyces lateritius]MBX9427570.1 acyl-CoA dehydrogenase family protein [Streptomyces lateritius]
MLTADIPTRTDLVRRAGELAPLLKKNAAQAEEDRRLQDETIEALAGAGLFKLRVPKRYGGYEADTRTLVEVAAELGRADGATAWTTSVYWIPTFMACLFPDSVQDEVFSTPDVRICGTLSPSAFAAPAEGGIVVNGKWSFVSGARHAHWQEIIAVQPTPDGQHLPVMALVPMSDLQIIDDWDTSGLRGTGSVSTVAQDVFVPQERVIPLPAILQGQYASELNAASAVYRVPLLPVAAASSVGTALGLARAARDVFFDRLPGRTLTYTAYETQAEAPITHHQVAEAVLKIDQAEFHAFRLADLVDSKGVAGEEFTLEERARARADMGAVVRLAKEAVDILASASGGSSIYRDVPIQRISRDIQAISLHALMNPQTNNELYGRVLCGLEPNTFYI